EAASLLGLSSKTVYQWAAERRIPRVKLGGGEKAPIRFRLSSLLKLIEQLEEPALRAASLTSPLDSRKSAPGGGHPQEGARRVAEGNQGARRWGALRARVAARPRASLRGHHREEG